ncbi:MAG: flippase-like domain-containing protein [Cellulomonadaceae bacterium]
MPASDPTPSPAQQADGLSAAPPRAVHEVGSASSQVQATRIVRVVDTVRDRVRQPSDLLGIVGCVLGIGAVALLAVYAHATTEGVQADVQGFSRVLARLLLFPVALLEGVVTLLVPFMVILELSLRRMVRQLVESLAAAALGIFLAVIAYLLVDAVGGADLQTGLSVTVRGVAQLSMPAYVAGIAGLLTAAGPRTRRRAVNWSWNLLWGTLGILLITGGVSLPGVAITLLLGRIAGLTVRYVSGVRSERAYGATLVDGLRRAGFDPESLVRVRDVSDNPTAHDVAVAIAPSGQVDETTPPTGGFARVFRGEGPGLGEETGSFDAATLALMRSSDNRVYAMTTTDGPRLDVVVLDGDRQVLGMITRIWRSLRLRGIEGRPGISLRSVAERAALLMYAARAAGVRTPELCGMAEADDSMLLVQSHVKGCVPLRDLPQGELSDAALTECWRQLQLAHDAGLAHRGLTPDVVLVSAQERSTEVWLTGWESGDVASSELARRMDLMQMLVLLALNVGAERAIASAGAVLSTADIEAIGPMLQSIALPRATREAVREKKNVLPDLRAALIELIPEANVEPERLVRFGARTIITVTLGIVAGIVIITTMNFRQIADAVATAQPWWAVVCFVLGSVTWVGAAVGLIAFAPARISFWRACLTQVAASYVVLAAPAGIGPAALNLRLLTRAGVSVSLAGATVALVQVSQLVTTIVLLVLLTVVTGDGGLLRALPSTPLLWALVLVTVAVVTVLAVPPLRAWTVKKIMPLYRQIWPRLSAVLSQPGRLLLGLAGNAGMTLAYVFALDAALRAFGQEVALVDVAVIYLVGNTVGAAAPTPGGIGAIELVLTSSLTATAGIPAGIAASVVVLFRVMTYWIRIPLGMVAMRVLQRKGDL